MRLGLRDARHAAVRAGACTAPLLRALLHEKHLLVECVEHEAEKLFGVLLVPKLEEIKAPVQAHRIVDVVGQNGVRVHLEQRRVRRKRDLGVETESA